MEVLETARLRLRWFARADAAFMLGLLNEPAWIENIYDPGIRTEAQAAEWIADRLVARYWSLGYGFWAVERRGDGELLGLCGLIKRDGLDHPDLGYGFPARHWGRGYAREAAQGCLDYARRVLGMRQVLGTTGPENHASGRVLLAVGFTDLGVQQTAAHEGLSRVYAWQDLTPADDAAQVDALRARWRAALAGEALPALTACLDADSVARVMDGRSDFSPAALRRLAAQWAPLADDPALPAVPTPLGWRLTLPATLSATLAYA